MPPDTHARPPRWNFDVDRYISPFVVPAETVTRHLPPILRRFLGRHERPPRPLGNLPALAWGFVGTVGSLSLIYAVNRHVLGANDGGAPLILGSYVRASIAQRHIPQGRQKERRTDTNTHARTHTQ